MQVCRHWCTRLHPTRRRLIDANFGHLLRLPETLDEKGLNRMQVIHLAQAFRLYSDDLMSWAAYDRVVADLPCTEPTQFLRIYQLDRLIVNDPNANRAKRAKGKAPSRRTPLMLCWGLLSGKALRGNPRTTLSEFLRDVHCCRMADSLIVSSLQQLGQRFAFDAHLRQGLLTELALWQLPAQQLAQLAKLGSDAQPVSGNGQPDEIVWGNSTICYWLSEPSPAYLASVVPLVPTMWETVLTEPRLRSARYCVRTDFTLLRAAVAAGTRPSDFGWEEFFNHFHGCDDCRSASAESWSNLPLDVGLLSAPKHFCMAPDALWRALLTKFQAVKPHKALSERKHLLQKLWRVLGPPSIEHSFLRGRQQLRIMLEDGLLLPLLAAALSVETPSSFYSTHPISALLLLARDACPDAWEDFVREQWRDVFGTYDYRQLAMEIFDNEPPPHWLQYECGVNLQSPQSVLLYEILRLRIKYLV